MFFTDDEQAHFFATFGINSTFTGSAFTGQTLVYIYNVQYINDINNSPFYDGNLHLLHIQNVNLSSFTSLNFGGMSSNQIQSFPTNSKIAAIGLSNNNINNKALYCWAKYNFNI